MNGEIKEGRWLCEMTQLRVCRKESLKDKKWSFFVYINNKSRGIGRWCVVVGNPLFTNGMHFTDIVNCVYILLQIPKLIS